MKRIGKTPEFGIPEDEVGLFISGVSFTPEIQELEQKDKDGEIQGVVLYGQKVGVEFTGEVPHSSAGLTSAGFKLGCAIELNNTVPDDCWIDGVAPNATTSILKAAPYQLSREGARERTYTGTIYPFDSSNTAAS